MKGMEKFNLGKISHLVENKEAGKKDGQRKYLGAVLALLLAKMKRKFKNGKLQ